MPVARHVFLSTLLLIILPGLSACLKSERLEPDQRPTPLLLISIDGFRHDYFDLTPTPALDRLRQEGLVADSLKQVFPTKTFPTHYSLVTGLYAGSHGVMANSMWDPDRNERFSLGNRDAVGDGYWYGGEPIWVSAENQGLISATFFWPGSEARIAGVRPTHWKPYDGSVAHADRIIQVLEWFALPVAERPSFVTLYFSRVDSQGHRHGPASPEVLSAIEDVDHHLGNLIDGLQELGLFDEMNIVIVSDHGMSEVDLDRYIMLDDYLDLSRVRVSDWGPAAQIWATDMSVDDIFKALDGAHPRLRVWRRDDIPARYHFSGHRRTPDVLAEADNGWMISNKPYMAGRTRFSLMGMHGWDPAWQESHGIFLARGPDFPRGARMPAVRSVDLYSLFARLLEIEPAPNDGSLYALEPYLSAASVPPVSTDHLDCQGTPMRLRHGLHHAALHIGDAIYVLDRVNSADAPVRQFVATDVRLELSDRGAQAIIDGQLHGPCQWTQ